MKNKEIYEYQAKNSIYNISWCQEQSSDKLAIGSFIENIDNKVRKLLNIKSRKLKSFK
jgi:hypothetical protein